MVEVTPSLYSTIIRVVGILVVGAMALFDEMQSYHNNEIWYATTIAALVIGPHALDKLSIEDKNSTASRVESAAARILPVVGVAATLFKFMGFI